jgi:hypothetical protein
MMRGLFVRISELHECRLAVGSAEEREAHGEIVRRKSRRDGYRGGVDQKRVQARDEVRSSRIGGLMPSVISGGCRSTVL